MRRAVSFLLVSVFLTSSGSLISAQKINPGRQRVAAPIETPKAKPVKVNQKARDTKFAFGQAFTQGKGVWVHWKMEAEHGNQGFYVYRIDSRGEARVSEFEMGGAMKSSDPAVYEQNYSFFDETGAADSVYYVEALGGRRTVRSENFAVNPVKELPDIGGLALFESAPKSDDLSKPTTVELSLPQDLDSEVNDNLVAADPVRHKEVIALPGAKIKAKATGLIRVTKSELQAAGFNVNGDSSRWQLYLEGVERPIIVGPNADYIEFMGRALDTLESDIRTYYLIEGSTAGKRIRATSFRPTTGSVVSTKYNQTFERKERTNYYAQILNNNLGNYWGRIVAVGGTDFTFTLTGIDRTAGDRVLRVAFQGISITPHSITPTLNGNVLPPTVSSNRNAWVATYTIPVSYLVDGLNTLNMKSAVSGDTNFFDYVSIDFPRQYIAENNRLDFYTENYKRTVLSGFSTQNVRLFDVTYEGEPVEYTNNTMVETSGSFGPVILANRGRLFYATEAANVGAAISVLPNDLGMLGVPSNAGTLVIIAHSSLMQEAQAWANYRIGQGVATKLVDVEDVFDEFNYGVSSSQSIEDFLYYAKNNWQTPPAYVLLIGDATYDPRNYENRGYWNMVPTRIVNTLFEETGSDEALADFNNDGLAELAIGRISARTGTAVTTVFNKTVTWEAGITPNVLNRGALFAYDQFDGYDFQAMSGRIKNKLPAGMTKTEVQRGVPNNTAAKDAVVNAFNSGVYIANYSGHGTAAAWRDSTFFWNETIGTLTNASTPSLVTALTCLNAYFVMPSSSDSFAETITKAPNGGAVAIWASSGKTTPDVQEVMALRFYQTIGEGNIPRLGDLIMDAKAQLIGGGDVRLSWALIGDPMLRVR